VNSTPDHAKTVKLNAAFIIDDFMMRPSMLATHAYPWLTSNRGQITARLTKLKAAIPFALAGIDTDNDSVFINETLTWLEIRQWAEASQERSGTRRAEERCSCASAGWLRPDPDEAAIVLAAVSSRRRGLLLCASHGTGLPGLASGSLDRSVRMAGQAALTPVRGG
jgi:hypothetical protein